MSLSIGREPVKQGLTLATVFVWLMLGAGSAIGYQSALDAPRTSVDARPDQAQSSTAASSKPGAEKTDAETEQRPVYVPPRLGAPATRVGGGTRTGSNSVPQIALLSPEHTGLTLQASPTLYWYLARDHSGTFEFVVMARDGVVPELRLRAEGHQAAGIHALNLAEHGVVLTPGRLYQWSVSIVRDEDHRSRDVVSVATIERLSAEGAQPESDAVQLAAAGLWYDAVDASSRSITQDTAPEWARAARAALLEQAGLASAAAWDRNLL